MPGPHLVARFDSAEHFLHAFQTEIKAGGLLVHGAELGGHPAVGECSVELLIAKEPRVQLAATIAAVVHGVGVAVLFKDPGPLRAIAERLKAGGAVASEEGGAVGEAEEADGDDAAPPPPGTIGARLQAMSPTEKMQLALSADRETRMHLLRDSNKTLHIYVLRNPRFGLDEVVSAAKMATLSPDALKFIAEHKEWGHNPQVCTAIARNPRAPVPLVLRVLPRVPHQEIRAIAKGAGRAPIVQAARKMINE